MPDYKPNYFVRAFAVVALIAALILVVVVIATTSGGSDDGDDGNGSGADIGKVGQQAVRKGVWIVRSGDTLGKISIKTGIEETVLLQLNPDLDPQALQEGQRIALR
jgi:LysM repeat protein